MQLPFLDPARSAYSTLACPILASSSTRWIFQSCRLSAVLIPLCVRDTFPCRAPDPLAMSCVLDLFNYTSGRSLLCYAANTTHDYSENYFSAPAYSSFPFFLHSNVFIISALIINLPSSGMPLPTFLGRGVVTEKEYHFSAGLPFCSIINNKFHCRFLFLGYSWIRVHKFMGRCRWRDRTLDRVSLFWSHMVNQEHRFNSRLVVRVPDGFGSFVNLLDQRFSRQVEVPFSIP